MLKEKVLFKIIGFILIAFAVNTFCPYPMDIVYFIPIVCFLLFYVWLFKRSNNKLKPLFLIHPPFLLLIGFYGTQGGVGEGHFREIVRIYHIPIECLILISGWLT